MGGWMRDVVPALREIRDAWQARQRLESAGLSTALGRCKEFKLGQNENGCGARPHPDLLPRGEGTAFAPRWPCG